MRNVFKVGYRLLSRQMIRGLEESQSIPHFTIPYKIRILQKMYIVQDSQGCPLEVPQRLRRTRTSGNGHTMAPWINHALVRGQLLHTRQGMRKSSENNNILLEISCPPG